MKPCLSPHDALGRIFLVLAALAGATAGQAAESGAANLVRDGNFDRPGLEIRIGNKAGPWLPILHREGDGALGLAPGEGRDGSAAASYTKTDAHSQNIHLDQVVRVKSHTIYEVSAWIRSDGNLRPGLVIYTPKWRAIAATAISQAATDWTELHLAFDSGPDEEVRLAWIPGQIKDRHDARPGRSFLDDVSISALASPPDLLRRAFDLARSREGEEVDTGVVRPAPIGKSEGLPPIRCRDGVLVYPDGSEVALWGVNFQTPLAWEYNGRLKPAGVPLEVAALNGVTDSNLAELGVLGADLIRIHLCPSDFTDAEGGLVETPYLGALDHLLARSAELGIRVYLTLINDMNQRTCPESFMNGRNRESWFYDPEMLPKLERYVQALLTRLNPASGRVYKDEPALAVIEIANEPAYPSWPAGLAGKQNAPLRKGFDAWRTGRGLDRWPEAALLLWRSEVLKAAIQRLTSAIRQSGAEQPVFWNLNWPGMVLGHEDIFQAVAESAVDGISFCLYPGQQDVATPFWSNPVNLDGKNYLPFVREQGRDYSKLRWVLGKRFAGKAKAVYEFETFYTQNSHLYPAMARLMRALGVQMAPMWTYTLSPSVERHSGSHHLSLYCTPRKAASFAIAGRLFHETPRLAPYPEGDDLELNFENRCLVSFPRDLSVWQAGDTLMHSRPIDTLPFPGDAAQIRHILAFGGSPLAGTQSTGVYSVEVCPQSISVRIGPDAAFVRPPWQSPPPRNSQEKSCALDWKAVHPFALQLPGWPPGPGEVEIRKDGGELVPCDGARLEFAGAPGTYAIRRRNRP